MAIVDRPLFADEAKGKIRSTVTFFARVANKNYTDPEPGERYHLNAILSSKQTHGPAREAWKEEYKQGVLAWHALTDEQKAYWNGLVVGYETGFNLFMEAYMAPPECPPQWYEGQPFDGQLSLKFTYDTPWICRDPMTIFERLTGFLDQDLTGLTMSYSYEIT